MTHVIFQGYDLSYSDDTVFEIQVSTNKSQYKTEHKVVGNLGEAIKYYKSVIMEYGDRKRIVMYDKVLIRARA